GLVQSPEIAESHEQERSTAQKLQNSTRWSDPPLKNSKFLRAGGVHRSEIAESHAREPSTAREMQNSTRGNHPPLKIALSHALEDSTAREMQNSTRGKCPPPKNRTFSRVGKIYHLQNIFF